jgi:hypothetical protein
LTCGGAPVPVSAFKRAGATDDTAASRSVLHRARGGKHGAETFGVARVDLR